MFLSNFFPPCFSFYGWFLVSCPWDQKKMLDVISILLNLVRLVLCPSMWSILDHVPCALKKNVYPGFCFYVMSPYQDVWKFKKPIKSNFSIVPFRISVALLSFCLKDMPTDVSGVLKVSYYYCTLINFSLFVC